MTVHQDNDPQLSGYDPQTWKDERRKKLERRKEDRQRQAARKARMQGRRHLTEDDLEE